jgi:epoxyqueuosine reductase
LSRVQIIQELAANNGLIYLGAVRLGVLPEFSKFEAWLDDGIPPNLSYMSKYLDVRKDPSKVMNGAQTALIVAVQYQLARIGSGSKIAGYANARDYHKLMKSRMHTMIGELRLEAELNLSEARFLAAVDTAPVLERALASHQAGFIGKNTCFISPKFGSALLIGEIFFDQPFEVETKPAVDPNVRTKQGGCGTCRRCQVHCPTGALSQDYKLDPSRCLSYWTIEHRDIVPIEFWPHFAKFWYGCDICQNVCPYNRRTETISASVLERRFVADFELAQVAAMDQSFYEQNFGGTPMVRAKIEGLRRNALIAMVAIGDPQLDNTISKILSSGPSEMLRRTIDQIPIFREYSKGGRVD